MQTIEKYSVPPIFTVQDEEIKRIFQNLKEESHRLQLENDQLKRDLEKEQLLHKTLYNEWKELKYGNTPKKSGRVKFKRFVKKRPSFYGLFAITILLSAFIVYLVLSGNAEKNTIPSQIPLDTIGGIAIFDSISKNKIRQLENNSRGVNPTVKSRLKKSP